jgi:hypothetical protein
VVLAKGNLVEPSCKVFLTEFVDVGMAINFDVVSDLGNVGAIKHIQKALALKGNGKFIIDHVQKYVCSLFIRCHNGKVVYLAFDHNLIDINGTRVKTRLMDCRSKSKFAENSICVFLP